MAAGNQIALVFRNANKCLWSGKGKRKGKIRKNNNKRSSRAKRIKTLTQDTGKIIHMQTFGTK